MKDDPSLLAYRRFQDRFGSDEFLAVAVRPAEGTVFDNNDLSSIERLCRSLETAPRVRRVRSVTRFETVRGERDDLVVEAPLSRLPLSPPALREAAARILADPRSRTVVRDGGRSSVILIETDRLPPEIEERVALVHDLRGRVRAEAARSPLAFDLLGGPVIDESIYARTRRDMRRNVPLLLAALAVLLAITLRGWTGLVFPLGIAVSAMLLTRMVQIGLGWKDNSLTGMVPVIVLVVGIADSVHIVVHHLTLAGRGRDGPGAAREAVARLFSPCFLTSLTTVFGFLALWTASLAPLRQLGALAAAGTGIAFALSTIVLPAGLSLVRGGGGRGAPESGALSRFVVGIPDRVGRRRDLILAAGALLTLLAAAGFPRIRIDSSYLEILPRDDPARAATEARADAVGGLWSLEILVRGEDDGAVLDPRVLAGMDAFAREMEKDPLVTGTASIADVLAAVNQALHEGDPGFRRPPERADLAAQYLLLLESSSGAADVERFVDLPRRHARIQVRTGFGTSSRIRALAARAGEAAARSFPPGIHVERTGLVMLQNHMEAYIIRSQIRSFLAALAVISLTMVATFRSWRVGLLSLIPNVWPIALTLGAMGWLGVRLTPVTAMVAAVVLGIAVDDTVHYLHRVREARAAEPLPEALRRAARLSGRAIVFTSLILLSGFLVISQSSLRLFVDFGYLSMAAIALALAGDLILLPALLLRFPGLLRPSGPSRPGLSPPPPA